MLEDCCDYLTIFDVATALCFHSIRIPHAFWKLNLRVVLNNFLTAGHDERTLMILTRHINRDDIMRK